MEDWAFNQDDLRFMASLGISESQVRTQMAWLQRSSMYLRLQRPCTLGDGIDHIPAGEAESLIFLQEAGAREGRFIKFVPASGAATRMFQGLLSFYLNRSSFNQEKIHPDWSGNDPETGELIRFISGIHRFAFWEALRDSMAREGLNITEAIHQKEWREVLDYLLTGRGLNYLNRPKGLHQFHAYPGHNRTAFEEHLVEAVHTICDRTGQCHLHLTIAPEHEEVFWDFFETLRSTYESRYQCRLKLTFSFQSHSTDTLAVDQENRPFRDDSGTLLFRPGGHGALLQNLNDLQGDLIYIKNIDNVLPDRLKKTTIDWKKILGGYLIKIQQTVHKFLRHLSEGKNNTAFFSEVRAYCRNRLWIIEPPGLDNWSLKEQKNWLVNSLNKPIRVCGMVKNEGEPGGGPFWVEGKKGVSSRQIVESVQVDSTSDEQRALWASSTHFNPVDLVCSVRDYEGRPFDLNRYVDQEAVFIARKSYQGRDFKALELPGLWNGSMADWISLFVEVPIQTFSPVKTINDLLRPEHQNEG
jgi:hypothetical protein